MTDKGSGITEDGVMKADMEQLMTPQAVKELKDLSPTMQQFLLRWQDKRDMILGDQLRDELKEFLLGVYEKDNDKLCKDVVEVMGQELRPINSTLKILTKAIASIATDITDIKSDVSSIKGRLAVIEDKQIEDERDIATLKEWAKVPMSYDERMRLVESYIHPRRRFVRYGIIVLLAVTLSLVLFFQFHNFKEKGNGFKTEQAK